MIETIREQKCCYLSTPKHIRSFIGMMVYIYTAKGELSLSSESLAFTSKKTSVEVPVDSITGISSGHYSRLAKPIRLDYIAVTYNLKGVEETILLTPTQSWATPVWKTNKLVASWISSLERVIHKGEVLD
ncbi:MAG: hypothetical protein DWQ04_16125 [Chloroflexi bacterium]|nr:MAG: hypothetical protein DWQ04_16125 [Chloroflexota bacterium]